MSWNSTLLQKPSKAAIPVSRTLLNPDKDLSTFQYLQFASELRIFQQTELITESYLSSRTYIINYNQHLQTLHFKKFRLLIQCLKRLKEADADSLSLMISEQFFNFEMITKEKKGSWTHLPDPEYIKYALLKFTGIYFMCISCIKKAEEVSKAYMFLIKREHFLHTSMLILSLASRVKHICSIWERSAKIALTNLRLISDFYQKPVKIQNKWGIPTFSPEELSKKTIHLKDVLPVVKDKKSLAKVGFERNRSLRPNKAKKN